MSTLLVKDADSLSALTAMLEKLDTLNEKLNIRAPLHAHSPMTDEDVYLYCNRRFAINKITKAMRNGEIGKCVQFGNKLIAQKRHVDEWLDSIFDMESPGTVAGYEVLPIQHVKNMLRQTA